jgi:hypothetical protein
MFSGRKKQDVLLKFDTAVGKLAELTLLLELC